MLKAALSNVFLGEPGRHRLRVLMTLLTLVIYFLFILLLWVMARHGLIPVQLAVWLSVYCLLGSAVFYLLVRSRLSERISSEPSLMVWQNMHSVLAVIWAYAAFPVVRGAVLAILVLIVAYGMFALSARRLAGWRCCRCYSWRLPCCGNRGPSRRLTRPSSRPFIWRS